MLPEDSLSITSMYINPSSRGYLKAMIQTSMPAINASLLQLNYTQDAHNKNFATVFGVMGIEMEMTDIFCSDFEESRVRDVREGRQ